MRYPITRCSNLEIIWEIFGFAPPCLPAPAQLYQTVLRELADDRNDLAHGRVDPVRFGRRKTLQDVEGMLSRVEDLAIHIESSVAEYLRTAGFRR